MTWQEARKQLLSLRSTGFAYPSLRKLARRLSCAAGTVRKAISSSSELQEWTTVSTAGSTTKVTGINETLLDSVPQHREPDPADILTDDEVEAVMAKLIDQATPDERAQLHALSRDERRKIAAAYSEYPEEGDRVWNRR